MTDLITIADSPMESPGHYHLLVFVKLLVRHLFNCSTLVFPLSVRVSAYHTELYKEKESTLMSGPPHSLLKWLKVEMRYDTV